MNEELEILLEKSSKAAKRRRRRERAKKKEKQLRKLKAKNTKKNPYDVATKQSQEADDLSKDKEKSVAKSVSNKLALLKQVKHNQVQQKKVGSPKGLKHLSSKARHNKSSERGVPMGSKEVTPNNTPKERYSRMSPSDRAEILKGKQRLSQQKGKAKFGATNRLGTRIARNLLTFEHKESQDDDR